MKRSLILALASAAMMFSCSKQSNGGGDSVIRTDTDSVAYVIGLNIAQNLLGMDSTINHEAVCRGIRDFFDGEAGLTMDESRTLFLRYVNHTLPEKARAYEEQYLEDIVRSDRSFARTHSGVTYAVAEIGDQDQVPASMRDTVLIRYTLQTPDGKELHSSYALRDTTHIMLGDMPKGLSESIKLIGQGGKITTWIPSKLAYGQEGNPTLGVPPNTTLRYEIELIGVDKYSNRHR